MVASALVACAPVSDRLLLPDLGGHRSALLIIEDPSPALYALDLGDPRSRSLSVSRQGEARFTLLLYDVSLGALGLAPGAIDRPGPALSTRPLPEPMAMFAASPEVGPEVGSEGVFNRIEVPPEALRGLELPASPCPSIREEVQDARSGAFVDIRGLAVVDERRLLVVMSDGQILRVTQGATTAESLAALGRVGTATVPSWALVRDPEERFWLFSELGDVWRFPVDGAPGQPLSCTDMLPLGRCGPGAISRVVSGREPPTELYAVNTLGQVRGYDGARWSELGGVAWREKINFDAEVMGRGEVIFTHEEPEATRFVNGQRAPLDVPLPETNARLTSVTSHPDLGLVFAARRDGQDWLVVRPPGEDGWVFYRLPAEMDFRVDRMSPLGPGLVLGCEGGRWRAFFDRRVCAGPEIDRRDVHFKHIASLSPNRLALSGWRVTHEVDAPNPITWLELP
ncbi:MAG: hypothetical protein IT384_01515 [Deltaproteobacteria bacterium]|nr:hypothetical protein [Deltaproteobacteria bacterium]